MKNVLKKSIFIFSLGLLVTLASCKKDDNIASPNTEVDETTVMQASESDQIVNDALATIDDAMDGSFDGIGNGRVEACGTVSLNLQQKSVGIDFGAGCQGNFGRNRKGKITVAFTDSQRSITFQDYAVEGYAISGTVVQGNIVRTRAQISYTTSASNLVVTTPNRKFTITNMQRTTQINLGNNPRQIIDNEVKITGTSAGINNNGENFTTEITSPLIIKQACFQSGVFYPVSGVGIVRVAAKPAITIDYGNGTCEKQITATMGNISKTITLP